MSNYHDNKDCLSGSFLKYIEVSSEYFLDMTSGDSPDEQNIYMLSGNVIHKYLLENDDFNNEFVVMTDHKPTSQNQKLCCRLLAAGNDLEYSYSNSYKDYNEKKAMALQEEFKDYIAALKASDGKQMIPESLLKASIMIDRKMELHKVARNLMLDPYKPENSKTYNEEEFYFTLFGEKFKSKIDRLIVDDKKKTISIVDLKTYTMRDRSEKKTDRIKRKFFQEKIYRQLALYGKAVDTKWKDYKIEYWIVFASANFYNYIDVMKVDDSFIQDGINEVEELVNRYKVNKKHGFDNDSYYYDNDGIIEMKKEEND